MPRVELIFYSHILLLLLEALRRRIFMKIFFRCCFWGEMSGRIRFWKVLFRSIFAPSWSYDRPPFRLAMSVDSPSYIRFHWNIKYKSKLYFIRLFRVTTLSVCCTISTISDLNSNREVSSSSCFIMSFSKCALDAYEQVG